MYLPISRTPPSIQSSVLTLAGIQTVWFYIVLHFKFLELPKQNNNYYLTISLTFSRIPETKTKHYMQYTKSNKCKQNASLHPLQFHRHLILCSATKGQLPHKRSKLSMLPEITSAFICIQTLSNLLSTEQPSGEYE